MSLQISQEVKIIKALEVQKIPKGTISRYWLNLVTDGMGQPVQIPIIVARGYQDGKVLGLTAAVHGNELNGIPVI